MAGGYFDVFETQDPAVREAGLMQRLGAFIDMAMLSAPGWTRHLEGIGNDRPIDSRAKLAAIPLLRKSALIELQQAHPPFGGFVTDRPITRIMVSPGPIYEPQAAGPDPWRMARALHAAGFRAGDIVHNAFAYHLTPAGFMLDEAARALGCAVIPAGTGNTGQQAETIARLRPVAYVGTPDYLKVLLDKVDEMGAGPASIVKALVTGGALFPAMRAEYAARGVNVLQCYATAELGLIAYESAPDGGMIVNEGIIVEIVRPGTGDPVPDGETGEVVVTNFDETYPLIRFATGDLSAVMPSPSPCGRTGVRLKGWMGRADQTAKVKGMFVRPEQIAEIGKRHPGLGRLRLRVRRAGDQDEMALIAETDALDEGLRSRLAETLTAVTRLKGDVEFAAPGSLPNDGKVIADERDYS
jgi:phenylacetate-CoA ligase